MDGTAVHTHVASDGDIDALCARLRRVVRPGVSQGDRDAAARDGLVMMLTHVHLRDTVPRALPVNASQWVCREALTRVSARSAADAKAAEDAERAQRHVVALLYGCTASGQSVTVVWEHAWRPWVCLELVGGCEGAAGAPDDFGRLLLEWLWGPKPGSAAARAARGGGGSHTDDDDDDDDRENDAASTTAAAAWPPWRRVGVTPQQRRPLYGYRATPGNPLVPLSTQHWVVDVPTLDDAERVARLVASTTPAAAVDRGGLRDFAKKAKLLSLLRCVRVVDKKQSQETKFALDVKLPPCSWVLVAPPLVLGGLALPGAVKRAFHTDWEVYVRGDRVPPGRGGGGGGGGGSPLAPVSALPQQDERIAPLLVASYDGEMSSHSGGFPTPLGGDYTGQVSLSLKRVGTPPHAVLARVVLSVAPAGGGGSSSSDKAAPPRITLPRDAPKHMWVVTCARDGLLLTALAALVRAVDADNTTNWNGSGFDNSFFWEEHRQRSLPLPLRGSEASAMLFRARVAAWRAARGGAPASAPPPPASDFVPVAVLLTWLWDKAAPSAARWLGAAGQQPPRFGGRADKKSAWGHNCARVANLLSRKYGKARRAQQQAAPKSSSAPTAASTEASSLVRMLRTAKSVAASASSAAAARAAAAAAAAAPPPALVAAAAPTTTSPPALDDDDDEIEFEPDGHGDAAADEDDGGEDDDAAAEQLRAAATLHDAVDGAAAASVVADALPPHAVWASLELAEVDAREMRASLRALLGMPPEQLEPSDAVLGSVARGGGDAFWGSVSAAPGLGPGAVRHLQAAPVVTPPRDSLDWTFPFWGRAASEASYLVIKKCGSAAKGDRTLFTISVEGRVPSDLMRCMQDTEKLEKYTLAAVSAQFLSSRLLLHARAEAARCALSGDAKHGVDDATVATAAAVVDGGGGGGGVAHALRFAQPLTLPKFALPSGNWTVAGWCCGAGAALLHGAEVAVGVDADGGPYATLGAARVQAPPNTQSAPPWVHVTAVHDADGGRLTLFVDAVEVASVAVAARKDDHTGLQLASAAAAAASAQPPPVQLADVRVYDGALDAADVGRVRSGGAPVQGKLDFPVADIFRILRTRDAAELGQLALYNVRDCDAVLWLAEADRFRFMTKWVSAARVNRTQLYDIVNSGQQARVLNLIAARAHADGYAIAQRPSGWPSKLTPDGMPWEEACTLLSRASVNWEAPVFKPRTAKRKPLYQGATVIDPKRGLYGPMDPVACSDFASLYPSVMKALNLCFSTLLVGSPDEIAATVQALCDAGVPPSVFTPSVLMPDGVTYERRTFYFVTHVQGLLPCILADLLGARKRSKKAMAAAEAEGDAALAALYNGKQAEEKVGGNSVYGATGVAEDGGKMSCLAIAAATTDTARRLLDIAKGVAEEHGAEVLYGDSVTGDTPLVLRVDGVLETRRIDELVPPDSPAWRPYGDKEAAALPPRTQVWTETGWTQIERVIRHACGKRLVRVLTHGGVADVTEDHSLLSPAGDKLRPTDVTVGTPLLHATRLPTASAETEGLCTNDAIHDVGEAWVMGLFFAAGAVGEAALEDGTLRGVLAPPSGGGDPEALWGIYSEDAALLECAAANVNRSFGLPRRADVRRRRGGDYCLAFYDRDTATRYAAMLFNGAGEAIVPHRVLGATDRVVEAFWAGFMAGKGGHHCAGVDARSKQECLSLELLAARMGYATTIYETNQAAHFRLHFTRAPLRHHELQRIREVRELPPPARGAHVYDLETASHHFHVGPGRMVVHNTDSIMYRFKEYPPEATTSAARIRIAAQRGDAVSKAINAKLGSEEFFATFSKAGSARVDVARLAALLKRAADEAAADGDDGCTVVSQSTARSGGGGSARRLRAASGRDLGMARSSLEIVLEKVMCPVLFMNPKMYLAVKYEGDFLKPVHSFPIGPEWAAKKPLVKGYGAARRDRTYHLRTLALKLIKMVLRTDDTPPQAMLQQALGVLRAHFDGMIRGDFPLSTFVQSKSLREEYASDSPPVHLAAVERAVARGDAVAPAFGSRVEYVIAMPPQMVRGGRKAKWVPSPGALPCEVRLFQRSEMPSAVERGLVPLDVRYYIESLQEPLQVLVQALHPDGADAAADLFASSAKEADAKALGKPASSAAAAPSLLHMLRSGRAGGVDVGSKRPAAPVAATAAVPAKAPRTSLGQLLAAAKHKTQQG